MPSFRNVLAASILFKILLMAKQAVITFPLYRDLSADDPWERAYSVPPSLPKFVRRSVPIRDVRHDFEGIDLKHSQDHLRQNGFTIVNHTSAMFDGGAIKDFDDVSVLEEVYYPECIELLKKTTGAKHVFITHSSSRQSHGNTINTGSEKFPKTKEEIIKNKEESIKDRSKLDERTETFHMAAAPTANVMHIDYSPRGARTTIRRWRADLLAASREAGIIQREDDLCKDPTSPESDQILEANYNQNGKGPRYACFSIWRPLHDVTRDPLGYAPRYTANVDGLIATKYENRVPGDSSLGGDFVREQEVFLIKDEEVSLEGPEFLYVSEQKPEEVSVFKLFDSAALGNATLQPSNVEWEASGTPHSSLDIGDAGYGPPRRSIDVRCIAVW